MDSLNQGPKGRNRIRIFVAVLAVGLVALVFQYLMIPTPSPPPNSTSPHVATLSGIAGDVRTKPERATDWFIAQAEGELMLGDAVYSGRDSKSIVRMASGGVLEMGANTLVVFT